MRVDRLMRKRRTLAVALFAAAGLCADCGSSGAERDDRRVAAVQRIGGDRAASVPGYWMLADPNRLVLREAFEADPDGILGRDGIEREVLRSTAVDGGRVLIVREGETVGGRIAVPGPGRYLVTVFAGGGDSGALPEGAGAGVRMVAGESTAPAGERPLDPWHDAGRRAAGLRFMLGATVSVPPGAEALTVVFRGGRTAPVEFDALRVVRLPAASTEPPSSQARTRITLGGRENRWVVPLFAGDRLEREIRLRGPTARLEGAAAFLSPAVVPGDGATGATIRVVMTAGGQREVLFERLLKPAPTPRAAAFEEFGISLDRWIGQRVTLSYECEVSGRIDPDSVFLLGSPIVRRSGGPGAPPSVIIVSIDTLRYDRLGLYGYAQPTSPFIDSLAARGVTVQRVYSPSSYTLPAHASLLTGQEPRTHGVERHVLSRRISPLLAEILAERGYLTLAATGGGYLDPGYGFAQGFDRYTTDDPCCTGETPDPASAGIESLLARIDELGETPFFLFLHTFAVHDYLPRPEDLHALGLEPVEDAIALRDRLRADQAARREIADREAVRVLSGLYDATIRGVDRVVERVVGELERRGILDRSFVLITSDHGEEFGEHSRLFHRHALYEESIRVPQIWLGPGLPAGGHASGPISLIDATPTLLALLEQPRDGRMQGDDVSAHLRGDPLEERVIGAALHVRSDDVESLVAGRLKWLSIRHRLGSASWSEDRLFDLVEDPLEQKDIARSRPAVAADLRGLIEERNGEQDALRERLLGGRGAEPLRLDAEVVRRLDGMGYVNGR